MNKFFLLLFLLFFTNLKCNATIEITSEQITTNNGLSDNSVKCIHQDNRGFLWIGTLNGISKYDGTSFYNFFPDSNKKYSLPDHRIKNFTEDKNGFLWITTYSNIFGCYNLRKDCFVDFTGCGENNNHYRYIKIFDNETWLWGNDDGCVRIKYNKDKFKADFFNIKYKTLPTNTIRFVEKYKHQTYIGTDEGLYMFSNNKIKCLMPKGQFKRMFFSKDKVFTLTSDGIFWIKEHNGTFKRANSLPINSFSDAIMLNNECIVFTKNGAYKYNVHDNTLKKEDNDLNLLNVRIIKDNKKNYWLYNNTGYLYYVNSRTSKVTKLKIYDVANNNQRDHEEFHVYQDSRGLIWITSFGYGLIAYNPETSEMKRFTTNDKHITHVQSNDLQCITEDKSGSLWIASDFSGISHIRVISDASSRLFPDKSEEINSDNVVRTIIKDNNNKVWLGLNNSSLLEYDNSLSKLIKKYNTSSKIYSLYSDSENNVWIGTRKDGLYINGKHYSNQPVDNSSISNNSIYTIHKDRKGRMWIGTFGGGLNLAYLENGKYKFKKFLNGKFGQRWIRCMTEDDRGYMWIGTSGGVFVFNPDEIIKNPHRFFNYTKENGLLRCNEIRSITRDSKGRIWIAEPGMGFCISSASFNYKKPNFVKYDLNNGLVSNMVQAFVQDNTGKMWISTEYGISCFNIETESFKNYFFSGSMMGNVFCENSAVKLNDGRLAFGSQNGLLIVNPKHVHDAKESTNVTFTNLKIEGITYFPDDINSPLKNSIAYSNDIELKYNQNSFTIDFSTLNYAETNSIKYQYKLDNYDDEWSVSSTLNFASYKNLSPGKYLLSVKACDTFGKWGKESTLQIIITPPFWLSTFAIILYIVLFLLVIYSVIKIVRNMNNLRNRIEIEKQLTEYKLHFFTNISHEFRTPLTLIVGAADRLKSLNSDDPSISYPVKIMDMSTKRLLRMVNQLIEFRKMGNNKLRLSLEKTDIIPFVKGIYSNFEEEAKTKNIEYSFNSHVNKTEIFIDKDKIDKSIYNLISNAFKYTPNGEKIKVSVIDNKCDVTIKIEDTGVGIPENKRSELFSRFMQTSFSENSMGIGLNLTKELVNLHKGEIKYLPNGNKGSIFSITLSSDESIYSKCDFIEKSNNYIDNDSSSESNDIVTDNIIKIENTKSINNQRILIIEDDKEIRDYLSNEIGRLFNVTTASDGKEGLDIAKSKEIDLIVCDVLMPGYSGYEVTKLLREDINTSHIPIILLTALCTPENNLEGINSGADLYMTKPFNIQILLANIKRILEQRSKLREKFVKDPNSVESAICTTDKDKEFSNRLLAIMESNIANVDLSVDDLASKMELGRTVFYSKVKGITGYSPAEYMKIIRLKSAAKLLLETNLTINEISFKVGIKDPFYFSRCFKNQFGVAPSIYQKGEKKKV